MQRSECASAKNRVFPHITVFSAVKKKCSSLWQQHKSGLKRYSQVRKNCSDCGHLQVTVVLKIKLKATDQEQVQLPFT